MGQVTKAVVDLGVVVDMAVGLGGKPYYIHWGWFQISAANLLVITLMVIVFALAVVLPFPRHRR